MISRLAATCAPLLACAALARAEPTPQPTAPTLTIAAVGEAKMAPDMASLSVGVQTAAPTAARAMAANAERAQRVIAALRSAGITGADLQTGSISLSPQMVYEQDKPPRLTGYQASNQLNATVRELSRLGPVVDALAAAGATDIGQISFGLSNPSVAEAAAREAAVHALQAKAAQYARVTGYRTVTLFELSEGNPEANEPRPMPMMAMRAAAAPTPVEPGQQTVRIEVTGMFELVR